MCYNAKLPTVANSANVNADLLNLTRVFNRWKKMLTSYGHLDESCLDSEFTTISRVIKSTVIDKEIRRAVQRCRDKALAQTLKRSDLVRALDLALEKMYEAQEAPETRIIRQQNADHGMRDRYRSLTRHLRKKRIRKIDRQLMYTDSNTDDAEVTKTVRRIVEKRAAQDVYRKSGKRNRQTNQFRQSVRRAISFCLYDSKFTEYDAQKRASGTHWRVVRNQGKRKKMLKAKACYNSYEEAVEACNRHVMHNPTDPRPMSAYHCSHCGKWHIGHTRLPLQVTDTVSEDKPANITRMPA